MLLALLILLSIIIIVIGIIINDYHYNDHFKVSARWLLDLEEFNEWMNEEDYLVEDEFNVSLQRSAALQDLTVSSQTTKCSTS